MAQLKDSLITGDLRVTGTIYGNVPLADLVDADDLKAIEGLTGTSGWLKKTAANTWALGTFAASDIPNIDASKITSGTLPIARGGTGLTASPSMLTNLASTTAANVLQASPRPGVTGTLGAANGGTGKTTLKDAANALINALDTGSSNLTANDYVITQYVGGGTTTTTYHRRPASALRVGGLLTARNLGVNLASTTAVTFDGTANQTNIPVSGTLPVANGGTGATSLANITVGKATADASGNTITTTYATKTEMNSLIAAADAMVFKGTIGSSGATVTALPNTHNVGWTYRVLTAGTYAGVKCEIGDLIICIADGTAANNAHWTVAQTNIDGAVVGPASATNGNIALFDGTTGKLIKNSDYSPSSFATAGHNHDSVYVNVSGDTMTGQLKTSFRSSVAMGAYQANSTTIEDLCEELRYSSGVAGSANITTAYTKDGVTIATKWYNFLWIPHRSGGINGAASGDNCNYGSLYLSGMTGSGLYMIRYASQAIAEVKDLYKDTTYGAEKGISLSSGKFGHSNTAITAQTTQAIYPIKIDAYGHITGYGTAVTSMTPTSHAHGNIANGGTMSSTGVALANGDYLLFSDASNSGKIERTSITFDGSTATKALTQKGTWETFNNYSLPLAASGTRGGIQIGYSSNGKNYAVQLSSEKAYVNVPWTDTDTKQNITLKTTTKGYITAVETAPTGTAAAQAGIADTEVYLTTTAGQINATSYKINEKSYISYDTNTDAIGFTFI